MAMNDGKPAAAKPAAQHQVYPSVLLAVGLVVLYLGERVFDAGQTSTVATALGALLVLGGLGGRIHQASTVAPQARPAERWLVALTALALVGLVLYFLNSSLLFNLTGRSFEQRAPRLSGVVGALWPALLFAAMLPMLFGELSLATMRRAPVLDLARVRAAMLSALGLSFALVFCFSMAYVTSERDVKVDLSYFRTARSGEATKKLVRALDKPVRVSLFFPPANEVREEIENYFAELTRESKQLIVESYDHALHPAKARELGVSGNGVVVIARDTLKEQIGMPLQLETARSQLRVLDQEVHKRIIGVSRPDRVAYFVQGHEERTFESMGDTDKRPTVRAMKDLLVDMGYEPKDLGMAQGLGSEVPADAGLVLLLGPRKPLLKEETAALLKYLDRKGRLLIALDPEAADVNLEELLTALNLKYFPINLAHERNYVNRTFQNADRVNLATGAYSSHSSVSTVGRFGMRAPFIVVGSGYLEKSPKPPAGIINVDFIVHAEGATFADKNGDFQFNEGQELRAAYELAAAVSKRNASAVLPEDEARAVVLGDADALSDLLIGRSVGNTYLARDVVRWLGGEEAITGAVNTEEDVPIAHTRKQDLAWFYSSIFVAPALVLGAGFFMTRRRRAAKKDSSGSAARGGSTQGTSPPPGGAPPPSTSSEVSP